MSDDKALREAVQSLSDWSAYVSLEGDEIVLDGRFTRAELEAIVAAMKAAQEAIIHPCPTNPAPAK